MSSNLGFLLSALILREYNLEPSFWDANCEPTASQNVYKIEYQDFGNKYSPSDVGIQSERIVCAMRSIDAENGTLKDGENYKSLYQMFVEEWDNYQKTNPTINKEALFLEYAKSVANAISSTQPLYNPIANALRRNIEVVRAEWGFPYDPSFSYEATRTDRLQSNVAQGVSLVSKYNRKARSVAFLRPQISKRNLTRIGISIGIVGLTLLILKASK